MLDLIMADPAVYESDESELNSESVQKVLQFLQKHGFKEAENVLSREAAPVLNSSNENKPLDAASSSRDLTNLILSQHGTNRRTDPSSYFAEYQSLVNFVDSSFDKYKPELACLLYPIFAHMYLELLTTNHTQAAINFHARFASVQQSPWQQDIHTMKRVVNLKHLSQCELLQTLVKNHFVVRMSKACVNHLKPFLLKHLLIQQLLRQHMQMEALESAPRSKEAIEAMTGGVLGEALKNANKTRVYYTVPKEDFTADSLSEESLAKKRRQSKGKDAKDKKKGDPNAPSAGRIPLPEWSDYVRIEKRKAQKDSQKRYKISPESLPSVCFYTILNGYEGVSSCILSEDCTTLAAGYGNSGVQVWSLTPEKLKPLKPFSQLEMLDQDAEDVDQQILDDTRATTSMTLTGHYGAVYGVSFSPDKRLLLSCSEDSTVRLWSTQLWSNLVVYRIGGYPIWDVAFCPRGYYFATGSADRTAMLWSTEKMQPIRLFSDHFSDVNCVEFNPNCNYLATGSEDRSVRIFDLQNGSCVRYFTGQKAGIQAIKVSHDGKLVASAGSDGCVQIWEVGQSKMLASYQDSDDTSSVYSMAFSRDNTHLACGGLDNYIRFLSVEAASAATPEQQGESTNEPKVNQAGLELTKFKTKESPVVAMNFTSKNLLLAVGAYGQ